jgi:hypothetical protein
MIYFELRKHVLRYTQPVLHNSQFGLTSTEESTLSDEGYNFRSVYGYSQDTAVNIDTNGHTRGLKGLPVGADNLVIDVDDDKGSDNVLKVLTERGIKFDYYDTGNRGKHFHIPTQFMFGNYVISSHIAFLEALGIWDIVDKSIYREGGQYRLVGAKHHKTGQIKRLIKSYEGQKVFVPIVHPKPDRMESRKIEAKEEPHMELRDYFLNLSRPSFVGNRHNHFFILWRQGQRSGVDLDQVEEDIHWYNDTLCDPAHDSHQVDTKIRGFSL